jgi:GMP synthase-like glutamine amidotransferase
MKIGILLTQPAIPERDKIFGTFADMFKTFLLSADNSLSFTVYDILHDEWPESLSECDGWLITGSMHDAYGNLPWITRLKDFIVRCNIEKSKLIGICFGHQIIAEALGGKVEKAAQGWGVGVHEFNIEYSFPWMKPSLSKISLLYSHQDQVVRMPHNATLIGGDPFCPHRMFTVEDHILAIQGHPEFSSEFEAFLLESKKNNIPSEVYNRAVESLSNHIDNTTIAKWMVKFYV